MAKKYTNTSVSGKYNYRFVVLRLWHKELDPDSITRALKIEPSNAWRRGYVLDKHGNIVTDKKSGKPYRKSCGQWNLCSSARGNSKLVTHIKSILEIIKPKKKALRCILKKVHADLNIAIEPPGDLAIVGYSFPADILNEFTSLGIDIHISIHVPSVMHKIRKELIVP